MDKFEKYLEFKQELNQYESKSKNCIQRALFLHKSLRLMFTKEFDFFFTLTLNLSIFILSFGFNISILKISIIIHFFYWITIYSFLSRFFESDDYDLLTMRIKILETILSEK